MGSNGHMTDPFLRFRCHRDLDLDLCDFWVMNLKKMNQTKVVFVCDFWVMNLILFEVNQGEMNSMEFWLDVSSSNEPYLSWLQVKGPATKFRAALVATNLKPIRPRSAPGLLNMGCHIFHTVDSPMSKEGVFFVEASWVYQKAPKILVSILFWAQLEKSGLQIRKSSAENINFLLQVKIPNNQTK